MTSHTRYWTEDMMCPMAPWPTCPYCYSPLILLADSDTAWAVCQYCAFVRWYVTTLVRSTLERRVTW